MAHQWHNVLDVVGAADCAAHYYLLLTRVECVDHHAAVKMRKSGHRACQCTANANAADAFKKRGNTRITARNWHASKQRYPSCALFGSLYVMKTL